MTNPKPYFGAYNEAWTITRECIPLMLESFNNGTQFLVSSDQFESDNRTSERFEGWVQVKAGKYLVRVSNDERRRLLPILRLLRNKVIYQ